jgi:xanthine dehydrogenase YagS FAD-binding subunit
MKIFGPKGERQIELENFFRIPQSEDEREYDLAPNEILTDILVPPPSGIKSATYEVRQREALDWPLVTASVALRLSGRRVESARIVLGHVAPIPWRSKEAEQAITGKEITEETAQSAGEAAVRKARSLGRNGYKIQLARTAVKRALLAAVRAQ